MTAIDPTLARMIGLAPPPDPALGQSQYSDQDLGVEAPQYLPDLPAPAQPGIGQSFLASLAGLQGVQGPNPRSFGEGLVSGLTQGLGSAGARALAQRQRLEAIQQQQQALRNEQNLKATEDYRQNRAKALQSSTEFNRTHVTLTPEMQANNADLQGIPVGTKVTPDLVKGKSTTGGSETEQFLRMPPDQQAKFLDAKTKIAAAGQTTEPDVILSPDTIKYYVGLTLSGGGDQSQVFGRTKEGLKNRSAYQTALQQAAQKEGIGPGDIIARQFLSTADKASLAKSVFQRDQLEPLVNTLHDNADLMLNLANKIPDVGSLYGNKALREGFKQFGSQDITSFKGALASVRSEANFILNTRGTGGGAPLSDKSRQELEALIGDDFTYDQLRGAIATIKSESANRLSEQQRQIDTITGRITGRGAPTGGFTPKPGGFFDANRPTGGP